MSDLKLCQDKYHCTGRWNHLKQKHTRSKALRVASFVVTLPNTVVKPKISNSGVWNAIKIAMLSSENHKKCHSQLTHEGHDWMESILTHNATVSMPRLTLGHVWSWYLSLNKMENHKIFHSLHEDINFLHQNLL